MYIFFEFLFFYLFKTFSSINTIPFVVWPIPSYGCLCPNCGEWFQIPQKLFGKYKQQGWPNYKYGQSNYFQITVESHGTQDICLTEVSISLETELVFPKIQKISPNLATKNDSSKITISLNYLNPSQIYSCFWGTIVNTATQIDNQTLECKTIYNERMPNLLSVSPNWADPSKKYNFATTFYFYDDPIILSISPTHGDFGTNISIQGSKFVNSSFISCQFNQLVVKAKFISQNELQCQIPFNFNSNLLSSLDSNVQISVSLNGQNFPKPSIFFHLDQAHNNLDIVKIVGIILGTLGGILTIVFIIILIRYERNKSVSTDLINKSFEKTPLLINDLGDINGAPLIIDMKDIFIKQKIGRGSFGDIYLALWKSTEVAVKKIPYKSLDDETIRELSNEARIMNSIRHPHVLSLMGISPYPPEVCIIMEYMSHGSLFEVIKDKKIPLSWELKKRIASDAAKGMNFLHHHEPIIIHRDLKTQNLLLDDGWRVKVADFGLSRIIEEKVSTTMTICGTPCWTAPEVLRNQKYSIKADIYSFGICLWELSTRKSPYQGMSSYQVMFEVASKNLRPPVDDIPAPWRNLMIACWSENPDERPEFDEIIKQIELINIVE